MAIAIKQGNQERVEVSGSFVSFRDLGSELAKNICFGAVGSQSMRTAQSVFAGEVVDSL